MDYGKKKDKWINIYVSSLIKLSKKKSLIRNLERISSVINNVVDEDFTFVIHTFI